MWCGRQASWTILVLTSRMKLATQLMLSGERRAVSSTLWNSHPASEQLSGFSSAAYGTDSDQAVVSPDSKPSQKTKGRLRISISSTNQPGASDPGTCTAM